MSCANIIEKCHPYLGSWDCFNSSSSSIDILSSPSSSLLSACISTGVHLITKILIVWPVSQASPLSGTSLGPGPGQTGKRREARKEFVVAPVLAGLQSSPVPVNNWMMNGGGKTCAGDYIWLRDQGRSLLNMMEETQLGQNCRPLPGSDNIGTIWRPTRSSSWLLTSIGLVLSPERERERERESQQFLDTKFMLLNKIRNGQIIQIVFHQNKTQKIFQPEFAEQQTTRVKLI